MELNVGRKKVIGSGTINGGNNMGMMSVILEGGYRNDRFLKMDYHNKDTDIIQFGTFILELSEDKLTLKGNFLGYGPYSKKIVDGTVELTKQP